MSFVFKINEELSATSVTAIELISITRTFHSLIKDAEFTALFDSIVATINQSYQVVDQLMSPFLQLDDEASFTQHFDQVLADFKEHYLFDVSKPRRYCDNVYDDYIKLQHSKQAKSGFPLLRRTFARLDGFYDKWITNDNLLAMSIDNAIKLYNRHLSEIAEIKQYDAEDAFVIHHSANEDLSVYTRLIQSKYEQLVELVVAAFNTNENAIASNNGQ